MLYWQRFRFGLKRLFLQPALSVPVVLSLGLTLAAVLTVLSVYYTLMIRPLPQIQAPEQLSVRNLKVDFGATSVNLLNQSIFAHFKQHLRSYGQWGFVSAVTNEKVQTSQQEHQLTRLDASAGVPELLGAQLLLGSSSTAADQNSGVWISESVWQQLYQRDAEVIGQTLSYKGKAHKIAGVYKDVLAIPTSPEPAALQFWHFFDDTKQKSSGQVNFGSSGVTIFRGQKQPDEATIQQWLQQFLQDAPELSKLSIVSSQRDYRAEILGDKVKLIWLLLAVTLTLLLIAALNLTNLLLAHYQSRSQEFAVQMLTGCSVFRLKLLVAVENLSLVLPSVILGVLTSLWLVKSLPFLAGDSLPLLHTIRLDAEVLAVHCLLAILLLVLFSWPLPIPAQLASALSASGKGQTKQQNSVLVNVLFISQLTLSTIIICGSVLLAYQGYRHIYTGYGFELVNSYMIDTNTKGDSGLVALPPEEMRASMLHYQQRNELLQQKVRQRWPEAIVMNSRQQPVDSRYTIRTMTDEQHNTPMTFAVSRVDSQYFAAYGIPLLHGRTFTAEDSEQAIIIDLTLARQLSAEDPAQLIGRRQGIEHIVGIVAPVKNLSGLPMWYVNSKPLFTERQLLVVVLPEGQSLTAAEVQQTFGEFAAEYPELKVESMQQHWLNTTRQDRINFYLISAIAATALLLALLGIAGMSQQQSRRKRYEIAVRMATGASQRQLLWFAGRHSGLILLLGIMFGSALTLLIFNYISGYFSLFKVMNWQALLLLEMVFAAVALVAMLWPCWQVVRHDPIQTLRNQ